MVSNYSVPTNRELRGDSGLRFGTSWDSFLNGNLIQPLEFAILGIVSKGDVSSLNDITSGSDPGGALDPINNCDGYTSTSAGSSAVIDGTLTSNIFSSRNANCDHERHILCICF